MPPDPLDAGRPETGAERRHAEPDADRIGAVEAVLSDAELTPPAKLDRLMAWDAMHGTARAEGHGRVADAADLGFPDPAPYTPEVQRAIVELYRLHRNALPRPQEAPWTAWSGPATRKADNRI